MVDRAIDELGQAGDRMAKDFNRLIADGEDLMKAAASVPGEGLAAARTKFEEKLKNAKTALAEASQSVVERTRETAAAAGQHVRGNPWAAVGVALAAGALLGFMAAKR